MEAWQQRVVEEERELAARIERLDTFIEGPGVLLGGPTRQREQLVRQRAIMVQYVNILRERIGDF